MSSIQVALKTPQPLFTTIIIENRSNMSKTQMVGARVPLEMVEEISKAVENGYYLTPSHFIKKAIERELKRLREGL